ncbi:MAG: hypothetical protein JSU01_21140 [Bacteroidetes bacterium]|nr:hypothetical protein [Bacteroidota bacterium]
MTDQVTGIMCYPGSKIYIFCPGGFATGGPEALHQLAHYLNTLGFKAFMYYYQSPDTRGLVHDNYKNYDVPYVSELENNREHVLILPETHLLPIFNRKYGKIRKMIWWLSVTNYHIILDDMIRRAKRKKLYGLRSMLGLINLPTFSRLKQKDVVHIGHSHYSMVHLRQNGVEPAGQISDYMNATFFELVDASVQKEDILVYNPKKNDEFLEGIIAETPGIIWKPLTGMTPAEVAHWMNRAKLYIDFGYHPGKERMPREACIMRCCMIIGKTGSAAYAEDMPIPDKYRFEKSDEQIPAIIERINDCLENYDKLIEDFDPYRRVLYHEEEQFIRDIGKIFVKAPA